MSTLVFLGAISVVIWLGILMHPARPWDFQPVGDDGALPPTPPAWPSVCILIPARNESTALPHTLPALLQQDYLGDWAVILIDDRSTDGTANIARQIAEASGVAERLTILSGAALPRGWVGKVWALEQGARYCGLPIPSSKLQVFNPQSAIRNPQYLLLTDADIHHAHESLRRLVAESEAGSLALNSRMARLRCISGAERLLIPAFVFFFNLLYPMRRVNDQRSAVAAAAGGCVLLASSALERTGGFAGIKNEIIDDVSLARQIKRLDVPIHLALSRHTVESLRTYDSLAAVWAMVRRTAFTELRYSWLRLAGTLAGLALMFLLPLLWMFGGAVLILASVSGWFAVSLPGSIILMIEGFCAWLLMALVYRPAVHFFGLSGLWAWTLPLAGILYGAMTVDSALRYLAGIGITWRDR
ncbi:MAG: glycosyltransferase [Candidatus Binatia bacterium]